MNHTGTQCEEELAELGKVMSRIFLFLFLLQIKYAKPEYENISGFGDCRIRNVLCW